MLEYIIFAQDVETYGVEHFPVQLKGEKLRFGIENRGVVVSDENGDVPFLWDEISDMTVHDKKFVMKLIDGSVSSVRHSKIVYGLSSKVMNNVLKKKTAIFQCI